MKRNVFVLVCLLIFLVSSHVYAGQFLPMTSGSWFAYYTHDSADPANESYLIWLTSGNGTIDLNGKKYKVLELISSDDPSGFSANMSIRLFRSTAKEVYSYGANGYEHLAFQNAPQGTSWIYKNIRGGETKRVIEQTGMNVTVNIDEAPATFTGCIRTCGYDNANYPATKYSCDIIKPGFGMIRSVDFYAPNAPIITELISFGSGSLPVSIPPQ